MGVAGEEVGVGVCGVFAGGGGEDEFVTGDAGGAGFVVVGAAEGGGAGLWGGDGWSAGEFLFLCYEI